MAAVAACQWRVEGMRIRVTFEQGLLVNEIRPLAAIPRMLSHPTHDMVVTYMHNMACSFGLREFRRSDNAPDFAATPRML